MATMMINVSIMICAAHSINRATAFVTPSSSGNCGTGCVRNADSSAFRCQALRHASRSSNTLAVFPASTANHSYRRTSMFCPTSLSMASTDTDETTDKKDEADEIEKMRAKEIRAELDSYGVSTKSFLEKSELVTALKKARAEGMTPIESAASDDEKETTATATETPTDDSATADSAAAAETKSDGKTPPIKSRDERLKEEMEKCKAVRVGELKKELESYGVSTKSYFEKTEFVRAVAEARVDGVKGKEFSGGGSRKSTRKAPVEEEVYDPSFRDVTVSKYQGSQGGNVIDAKLLP